MPVLNRFMLYLGPLRAKSIGHGEFPQIMILKGEGIEHACSLKSQSYWPRVL